jgi:hypothetical protein
MDLKGRFLALALALLLAGGAACTAALATPAPAAAEEEFEIEAEEEPEETEAEAEAEQTECEEAEGEGAVGEIDQDEQQAICAVELEESEKALAAGRLPEECLLRSFHPHAVVRSRDDRLKLTIGYATHEPTRVSLAYGFRGLHLGTASRRLGKSGVVRVTKHLSDAQAAMFHGHRLVIRIRIPHTPPSCNHYYLDSTKARLR